MPHPHWVTRYYRSTWKDRWDHPVYQKWSYAHSQGLAVLRSTPNLDPGSVTPTLTYAAPALGDTGTSAVRGKTGGIIQPTESGVTPILKALRCSDQHQTWTLAPSHQP